MATTAAIGVVVLPAAVAETAPYTPPSRVPFVRDAIVVGDNPFFSVELANQDFWATATGQSELWTESEGKATRILAEPMLQWGPAGVGSLVSFQGRAYFINGVVNDNGGTEQAIWSSDGTVAGTAAVEGLSLFPGTGSLDRLGVLGNKLIVWASNGTGDSSLWSSDGSADGTALLATMPRDSATGTPVFVGGKLIFPALQDGVNGAWATDGTVLGTRQLTETGTESASIQRSTAGAIVSTTSRVWTTDGTVAGTRQIFSQPSDEYSALNHVISSGTDVYFQWDSYSRDIDSQVATVVVGGADVAPPTVLDNSDDSKWGHLPVSTGPGILVSVFDGAGGVIGSGTADGDGYVTIKLNPEPTVGQTISVVATSAGKQSAPTFHHYNINASVAPVANVVKTANGMEVSGTIPGQFDGTTVTVRNSQGIDIGNATAEYMAPGTEASFTIEVQPSVTDGNFLNVSYIGGATTTQLWCSEAAAGAAKRLTAASGSNDFVQDHRIDQAVGTGNSLVAKVVPGAQSSSEGILYRANCATGTAGPALSQVGVAFTGLRDLDSVNGSAIFFADGGGAVGSGVWLASNERITRGPDSLGILIATVPGGAYYSSYVLGNSAGTVSISFTDGTSAGTRNVSTIPIADGFDNGDMLPRHGFNVGEGRVLFPMYGGSIPVVGGVTDGDVALWSTDGTAKGTYQVADLLNGYLDTFDAEPRPTIAGGPVRVGVTLTAMPGAWKPVPDKTEFQWFRSGRAIVGATRSTLKLVPADLGSAITVQVTASADGRQTTSKTSAPTLSVVAGTLTAAVPTISGIAKVGVKLTATPGIWTAGTALKYQWYRGTTAIGGATAATYTPVAADLGAALKIVVTGSQLGYTTVAKTSGATPAVAAGTLTAPVPVVKGTAKVGVKLTATPGIWTAGTVLKYQWYRGGAPIAKATALTYTPVAADKGTVLKVVVTGSLNGYTTVPKTSGATSAVAAGTLTAPVPVVKGTAKVGVKLTATPGIWTAGTVLKYQWYRGSAPIAKATASTYTPVAADKGTVLRVVVTGLLSGYTTVAKTSAATSAVAAGTLTAPVPVVKGTAKVGVKLTATPGTWTAGTVLKYQWYRGGAPIAKATASTYKVAAADKGQTIKVRVTGSKAGYTTVAKFSATTKKVVQ